MVRYAFIFVLSAAPLFAATQIVNPRVNDRIEPVGVDAERIVFSWNLADEKPDTKQEEYRITVGDLWDTGWVKSRQCIEIPYEGKELKSSTKYDWSVEIKNNRGEISKLEKPASLTTGVLQPSDWKAKWISMDRTDKDPMPIFRKSFQLDPAKKIETAVVHVCGLGHFELNLNGEKVGDRYGKHFIDPGWTNYRKTCLYVSFDLTDSLKSGENIFGVLLGNGMYNVPGGRYVKFTGSFGPPKMICQLHVRYTDGTEQLVCSDDSWKASPGPIVFSCVYGGEDVDDRRLENGWNKPGFKEGENWKNATIVDGPGEEFVEICSLGFETKSVHEARLRPQEAPPITVAETKKPVSLERLSDGRYRADFGYNFSGRPRVVLKGKAGQTATVKTAEIVDRIWDGHSYTLTLRGEGEELLLPKFTYFGFQFLYLEGAVLEKDRTEADADKPTLVSFEADFTTSSCEKVGSFECSNELLNDIDLMIDRSVRSNLASVLTDCPHREKLGWLEVPHLMGPSIMGRYDVHNLYRKICRDTTESQLENGLVPDIAPEYTRFEAGFFETAEWGSACVQIPWLLFKFYGDTDILDKQKDTMLRYVDYLDSTRKENERGLVKAGLGDWYDWSEEKGHAGYSQHTPGELTATTIFIDNLKIIHVLAQKYWKCSQDDLQRIEERMNDVSERFFKAYYRKETFNRDPKIDWSLDYEQFYPESQAALAEAYCANNIEPYQSLDAESVLMCVNGTLPLFNRLVAKITEEKYKPSFGEVSFVRVIRALARNDDDVLWKMIHRTDKPGYGYMLREKGMKTLSETWDGPGASMNHCMFGHIQEWFTETIVGINIRSSRMFDPTKIESAPLFRLNPTPVGDLTWAKGHYDSVYGRVESSWKILDGKFQYRCVIPANTTAVVRLPKEYVNSVTINGKPVNGPLLELGSGTYEIESEK